VAVLVAGTLTGCLTMRAPTCTDPVDYGELSRLARATDSGVRALRGATDSQTAAIRITLHAMLSRTDLLDRCGRIITAEELRTASRQALEARTLGEPAAQRAYLWSRRAVLLDTADRRSWRAMAHAWDQLQVTRNQPQWFGTAVRCGGSGSEARCGLAPIDTLQVTDPQRAELGLRTLVQQRAIIDSMNRARGRR
jgi:hypothetical protein